MPNKDFHFKKVKQLPEGIVKECKHHGYLTAEEVSPTGNKRKFTASGLEYPYAYARCKKCRALKEEKARKRLRKLDPDYWRKKNRWHRFGLTKQDYWNMHKKQNGVCAICLKPETCISQSSKTSTVNDLCVDHCHETGKIRQLLCNKCNRGLGFFNEDIKSMELAIDYLRRHKSNGAK
jgi:hypothetical protein